MLTLGRSVHQLMPSEPIYSYFYIIFLNCLKVHITSVDSIQTPQTVKFVLVCTVCLCPFLGR